MRARKKPIEVEVFHWPPDHTGWGYGVAGWIEAGGGRCRVREDGELVVFSTFDGPEPARAGDWIIKEGEGKYSACKPDVFEASYDLVEEDPGPPEPLEVPPRVPSETWRERTL